MKNKILTAILASLFYVVLTIVLLVCQNGFALSQGQFSTFTELSAEADPHTGSVSFSVPIQIPPGRGGIQPNIQLQYNSNRPNGILGVGWHLELGSIRRSHEKGFPQYNDTDTFVFLRGGGANKLAFDEAAGFYRYEKESAFLKIEKLTDHWLVTDKQGVKYYFGETNDSRAYDPDDATHVYKWCLDRVEDLSGNYATYTYQRVGNRLYPQYIDYTGNAMTSEGPYARLEFEYESRPEAITDTYNTGFRTSLNNRLSWIVVKANGLLQRKYQLQYAQGESTSRSLLTSVTMYGADGQSTMPPMSFAYAHTAALADSGDWAWGESLLTNPPRVIPPMVSADFNADGQSDVLAYAPSLEKMGFIESFGGKFDKNITTIAVSDTDDQVVLGDFDGDGRADVCIFNPPNGTWDVALYDGSWLGSYEQWMSSFGSGEQPSSGDFNGDGKTDIMTYYKSGGYLHVRIALNTGGGFTPWAHPDIVIGDENNIPFIGDFNGDGLFDFGAFDKPKGEWKFKLNTGKPDLDFVAINTVTGFAQNKDIVIADINNDGLTDIGYYDTSLGKFEYRTSHGASFSSTLQLPVTFNIREATAQILPADFNGDTLTDYTVCSDTAGSCEISYSHGSPPDLLTSIDNGVGGVTSIEYGPFVQDLSTYMPFAIQVVKTITKSNNLGDSFEEKYDFDGAQWTAEDREFHGFRVVTVTDQEGNYTRSRYMTDEYSGAYKGKVREQYTCDASGKLYNKVKYEWGHEEIYPGIDFVYISHKDNLVFNADGIARRTAEKYHYEEDPQYGDLTRITQYGEVDPGTGSWGGDDGTFRRIFFYYTNNQEKNVVGLPYLKTVEEYIDVWPPQITDVRKTRFYYDGLSNGEVPVKGLLTKKMDWRGGLSIWTGPITTYTYDAYGNLLSTTSPNGNATSDPSDYRTTITYDSTYHVFPVETNNALNFVVKNEYYGVNETLESGCMGLWGQLKATTDPNDQTGKRSYDTFGRIVKTIGPEDSIDYPTTETTYQVTSDHVKITTRARVNHHQGQTIDAYKFIDGLGRVIQTKTPTAVPGQYTVSGLTAYNSRGLAERQYLPFFSTNPIDTIENAIGSPGFSEFLYDSVGRRIKTVNPDGTYSNVVYDNWRTEVYDENGHRQDSEFDAYGRLIQKIEYRGADGRAAAYYPQSDYSVYAITQYQYDTEGNLVKTIDAKNNETTIEYDRLGRKISMDDPDMGTWQYEYDLNGNLIRQTDEKGQVIHFTYDQLDRLVNKTDGGNLNVQYTYDDPFIDHAKGRLTKAQYGGGDTEFKYDSIGQEIESIKKINGAIFGVKRNYDALNELLDVEYPDGENVYYKYNPAGQIERISNDPALFEQQSFDWNKDKTKSLVLLSPEGEESKTQRFSQRFAQGEKDGIGESFNEIRNAEYKIRKFCERALLNAADFLLGVRPAYAAKGGNKGGGGSGDDGASPVQLLTATPGDGEIFLTWTEVPSAKGYAVKFGTVSGAYIEQINAGPTGSVAVSGLTNGVRYYFVVGVIKKKGAGPDSNELSAIPARPVSPPEPLAAPTLMVVASGDASIDLSWSPVDEATGYKLYYGTQTGNYGNPLEVGNTLIYTAAGLENGTTYYFAVTSYDAMRESPYSHEVSAAPIAPVVPGDGLKGEYYNGMSFNTPILTRVDHSIDFHWSRNSPDPLVAADYFSIRWTGKVKPAYSESYTFYTTSDDGIRLWVNEVLLIDKWIDQSATEWLGTIGLTGGQEYNIKVEYYERGVDAVAKLEWESASQGREVVPMSALYSDYNAGLLAAPAQNSLTPGDGEVQVSWNAVTGAQWYIVKYGTVSGMYTKAVNAGNMTEKTVTGLTNGTTYYFAVKAYSDTGDSPDSVEESVLPQVSIPLAPLLDSATARDRQVDLSWDTVATATGYTVKYGTESGNYTVTESVGNVTGYSVTGLTNGTTYYFVVMASNAGGDSGDSNEISATPSQVSANPQLFVSNIEYNVNGQITQMEYGNGVVTTNTYDPLTGRLRRIETRAQDSEVLQDLNYTYDAVGNVLAITDNVHSASQTFEYDAFNRLVSATGASYGTKTYAYDEIGNITFKDGRTYYYGENNAGPHAVTSMSDGTVMTYDANGNMVMKQGADLIATGYEYDSENRLIKVTRAGATVAAYEYDGDGGRTTKTAYDASNPTGTCFLAGTPVMMSDGTLKAIEEIKKGDRVLSLDERTAERAVSRVTQTFEREFAQDYLVINHKLRVTANHLFYVEGRWREAGSLKVGEKLLGVTLEDVAIESIEKIHGEPPVRVYNIEVDQTHNYFVAHGVHDKKGVLVHNKFPGETANAVYEGATKYVGSLFEINGSRSTKYIFLGGARVAAVTNGKVMYYHADHLGGTNVLTDSEGSVQELIEYAPFGTYARHEKYGLADEVAWFYFTGKPTDDESGLMFYGARYYDPDLGRFITADPIIAKAGVPSMLNRYAYAGNNPIVNIDPSGHFFGFIFAVVKAIVSFAVAHPFIAAGIGATVGGAAGGISAAQNGGNVFQSIGIGAVVGGLSGFTVGLSPGTPGIGAGLGLLKTSAAVSLTSQVVDAAGQEAVAQGLRYASMGLSAAYVGLNVGIGVKDWAASKLNVTDLAGNASTIQSGDNVYVNGILTDSKEALGQASKFNNASFNAGITKVAHNPTSGVIADLTESFLQKITFTSSVDRQLAGMVKGLNSITFTGHSQGALIAGNALVNLGVTSNRNVVSNVNFLSGPLSQPRAAISAAIGGTGNNRFIYANNWGDPINLIGPNINPAKFLSGATFQVQNH